MARRELRVAGLDFRVKLGRPNNSKPVTRNPDLFSLKSVPGGFTGGATPVPIPNTEVKPSKADDTAAVRQWESRTLPGYNKGSLVERSVGLFFSEVPVCQGSAAPTPLGATLLDSLGGSLLEFIQLRSCDRSASVSSSFPSQPSLGGAPLLRCQVALSLGIPALEKMVGPPSFHSVPLDLQDSVGMKVVRIPLEAALERNCASLEVV